MRVAGEVAEGADGGRSAEERSGEDVRDLGRKEMSRVGDGKEKRKKNKKRKGREGRKRGKRTGWKGLFAKNKKGRRVAAKTQGVGKGKEQGETLGFGG